MGLCAAKADLPEPTITDEEVATSNDVDVQLLEQQLQELFKFKILLLGAGESGKSTIIKQISLIHKKKLPANELDMVGTCLHQNTVDCMKALLGAARSFGDVDLDEEDRKTEALLVEHDENARLSAEEGEAVMRLWQSETVQNAWSRRNEFWILDSFPYYIDNLPRFCETGFVPKDEDVVMARIRTTGIVTTDLESKIVQESKDEPDTLFFQVVDVGGQRNERKKWIHCFSDVKAILFIVNLAGYNQVMFEDSKKNRMLEEVELFHKVVNEKDFRNTPVFLFLNKKDIFESMIKDIDMNHVFEDYTGGKNTDAALDFIQSKFKEQLPPGKTVSIHVVSAAVKRDIKCAFDDVKKSLYELHRKDLLAAVKRIKAEQKALLAQKKKGGKGKDKSRV